MYVCGIELEIYTTSYVLFVILLAVCSVTSILHNIFNNILYYTVVFDPLSAGGYEVCLGSNETSDYVLVNITLEVNCILLEHTYSVIHIYMYNLNKMFMLLNPRIYC